MHRDQQCDVYFEARKLRCFLDHVRWTLYVQPEPGPLHVQWRGRPVPDFHGERPGRRDDHRGGSISGYDNFNITGVAYFPNATFDASGLSANPGLGSASGTCMEIIASSITLAGYMDFNSNCGGVNATTFTSVGGATITTAATVR
jgi:hypothetical protein